VVRPYSTLKRLVVGRPIASTEEGEQRLGKPTALAVFASDAISSTAYATEEILLVLVPIAGLAALSKLVPIAIVVTIVLAIVVTSYRQVIAAYPDGGGSYVVSKDNLGVIPSLVAGSSLMVDYVLTVAVSVSAGVAAIVSAFPSLEEHRVGLCLFFIGLMTFGNLRGLKEAGRTFAVPTYIYVVALGLLLGYGLFRVFTGDLDALPPDEESLADLTENGTLLQSVTLFYMLRAFSSGAVALSGVEAISNGVPAFRPPESRNAATTLVWMGVILGGFFFGISVLAHHLQPTPSENETLLSIMGQAVFGGGFFYYLLQFSTFGILILAANTAYSGFPLLSSIIARDGFLPRQLATRGDRLVYSNGILVLAGAAAVLVVAFRGETTLLIPLYAVGVFTGFTLSQTGMVRRHLRLHEPGWRRSTVINGVGAVATGLVLAVVVISKFAIGAWIPAVVIPLVVLLFRAIGRHYAKVNAALAVDIGWKPPRQTHTVVVPVGRVHRGVLRALAYARSLAPDRLVAISVAVDATDQERINKDWADHEIPIDLHVVYSPYRDLTPVLLSFLEELDADSTDDVITVVIPEFVVGHWWEQLLHNQSALALKARLLFRRNTVVTSVPYHLD
jgi:amino acid transporter